LFDSQQRSYLGNPPEIRAKSSSTAKVRLGTGDPVISVDAKKKELVGAFKNGGRTWRPKGKPQEVNPKDFPSLAQGKALPYGVYDTGQNRAVVNVGVTHDYVRASEHGFS
jgi:hypothetical protein